MRARNQKKQFWADMVGFKYKMSNIQAAIGCAQVERLDELVRRKKEILNSYLKAFEKIPDIQMNPEPEGTVNGAWMPTVVFSEASGVTREKMQKAFSAENIDARVFFWPLSSLDMFESRPENKISWSIPHRALNLPSYHEMTKADIERIIDVLKKISA